ncbi:hypothetical protein [Marinobacter sp. 2_MG-2023]|uniref:hypothetical protein n=1 Tax=Marinobacter sp. 2_MG-2023 TaxID=3062679 RepID=UPI0026E14F24|nr:hypothetical protein [Marinobacter sp. 2_MG-2023]MDO6444123.1 hypothetical protein [Marinobacter sp. 2_MG-2023]
MPGLMSAKINGFSGSVMSVDFDKVEELGNKMVNNQSLLEEFKKSPEQVAFREVALTLPQGTHLHFIDRDNNYFPPEGDAVSQLLAEGNADRSWSRIETRVGGGGEASPTWCIGVCGLCVS